MADSLLALLALLALCWFFATRKGLPAGLAPLLAVSCVMLWLSLGGVLGVLRLAGWLLYIGAFGLAAYSLFFEKRRAWKGLLSSPGVLLFVAASAVALVYFALRRPVFSSWDEFSFWGVCSKLVFQNGSLYTTAEKGWFWTSTEKPGLVLLGYFTQFFGGEFQPWKVYFGYALLLFACMAALLAPLENRHWRLAVPFGAAALVLPFFFGATTRTIFLSKVFLSAYGDLPAGLLLGGALAGYYTLRAAGAKTGAWPALLPLGALALTKDNVFPLVLVAAFLMALDTCLFTGEKTRQSRMKRAGWAAAFFAAPLAAYLVWGRHAAWAAAQNPLTGGEATGASPFGAILPALAQLVGAAPRSERFSAVLAALWQAFADNTEFLVSMAGGGALTAVLILLVFALAAFLAGEKKARLRVGAAAGVTLLGLLGYHFVLLVTFAFITKYDGGIPDYLRYVSSYYSGWMLCALCLLAIAARGALEAGALKAKLAEGAALLAGGGAALAFAVHVRPGHSVLDYPPDAFDAEHAIRRQAEAAGAEMQPGERAFFVSQFDDGYYWFRYSYHLLPKIIDGSNDGGYFGPPLEEEPPEGYNEMTREELLAYMEERGCTYILVHEADEAFAAYYGELFIDHLQAATAGPTLYRLEETHFVPASPPN